MEWLNPWALWLTTTLAFPLWLHLRQRSRPKEAPFPSLMLLQKGFPKAMRQKRLRDLLQLILRLLLLLCLVLALAQPRWREVSPWPTRGIMLIDNTVSGMLPDAVHGTRLAAQWRESQALEARFPDGLKRSPVLPEADLITGEERFGDLDAALQRLIPEATDASGNASDDASNDIPSEALLIPILPGAFQRLNSDSPLASRLKAWLSQDPARRLVLWKQGAPDLLSNLPQIARAELTIDAPLSSSLAAHLQTTASATSRNIDRGLLTWQGGLEKQIAANDGVWREPLHAEAAGIGSALGLGQDALLGTFRFDVDPEWRGPWNRFHFAVNRPTMGRILHLGETWASLPSLAAPERRQGVEHWPPGMQLPALDTRGDKAVAAVMLAGVLPASEDLERLATFVLEGGGLIVSLGGMTDITALNSRLLAPLGMGRITTSITYESPKALKAMPAGYTRLKLDAAALGGAGEVMRHYRQEPSPGSEVLVTTMASGDQAASSTLGTSEAIAVYRKAGRGHMLLWTTSIDSLAWSTVGLQALLPLTHQALIRSLQSQKQRVTVASDSVWIWPTTDAKAEVIGPDGAPFTRLRSSIEGLHLGPFGKTGFYTCRSVEETTTVVVNLVQPWLTAAWSTTSNPQHPLSDDESVFLSALGKAAKQVTITTDAPSQALGSKPGASWPLWLALAVLLLLLDGLVALLFAPQKPTDRAS